MIFNNARYITTLICSENHPQHYLRKYLKIAENNSRDIIMCNHAMPATMALVVNYLLHYNGEIYYGSKIVKAIIENFKDWDAMGVPAGKKDFYDLLVDRTSETDKYPRWADLDRFVIRKAVEEINLCSDEIHIEYETYRGTGRNIETINFIITPARARQIMRAHIEKDKRI